MTDYAWPALWRARRFEMRIKPNTRVFAGQYSRAGQSVDLLGELWVAMIELPLTVHADIGAQREAFFDRLAGTTNRIQLYHLRRPLPRGTITGSPTVKTSAAQLAGTLQIQTTAGKTMLAGDHFGFGGQVSRVMADATADGAGVLTVEIRPRVRVAVSAGAAITLIKPTVNFILPEEEVPTTWESGKADAVSFNLIEQP
jgi:hypothetical protein